MTSLLVILAFYYQQIALGNTSPEIIRDYIATEALVQGVNPQLALGIATRESKLNPNAVGDHGTSIGLWQVHLPAHPSISREMALNIVQSTQWAIKELKNGKCKEWSTCPASMSD